MSANLQPYRISIDAYHRMREVGILTEDDRVELIRGQIVTMSPKGSKHSNTVNRLAKLFTLRLHEKAEVHNQNPIRLADHSEPEPDLALLHPPLSRYDDRLPEPKDVILVVEVADSSLSQDRNDKTSLYAQAGIPAYWIVNLQAQEIEVYQQPLDHAFKTFTRFQVGENVPVAELGVELLVAEMLGANL